MTSSFVQFFENINFSSFYKGLLAHQIWFNLGQGKQSYIGGGQNPPPPQVENVLNHPGEIGLRDTCNSTPVSTSGTTSVTPSYSEAASGQEMQTHMDNSSSENQDVQQNQGTADNPISLDRDQFGEEN